jgi:hypothetical protein
MYFSDFQRLKIGLLALGIVDLLCRPCAKMRKKGGNRFKIIVKYPQDEKRRDKESV